MTVGTEAHDSAVGHPSRSSPRRSVLLGFVVQAVGALVTWALVDDRSGRRWSNSDFQEWVTLSVALAVLLAVLGGVLTRHLRTGLSVLMGCLLSTALGCAVFIGYAVVNSG